MIAKPLYQAAKETPKGPLTSPKEVARAFIRLRDSLTSAPVLSLPNPQRPFHLFTDERQGIAVGLLAQPLGPTHRPVAYLSKQLDLTAKGWPPCLRALAAAALLTREALKLTLQSPITVFSSHHLKDLLGMKTLPLLSPSRIQELHLLFIENPDITLSQSPPLNPASLLPVQTVSPTTHSCPQVIDFYLLPRNGLQDQPLPSPDLTLFVDGSSVRGANGCRHAAYAVVTEDSVLEAQRLPQGTTSQKAELYALIRALTLAQGKRVNIYTDSKYAFLIAHSHSTIWQERGFLTTKGTPITNASLINKLLQALSLPAQVAIVHCRGHQSSEDLVARGNNKADHTARSLTTQMPAAPILFLSTSLKPSYSQQERQNLLTIGGQEHPKGWIFVGDKIALSSQDAMPLLTEIHNSLHIGPDSLHKFLTPLFSCPNMRELLRQIHASCQTCSVVSSQGALKSRIPAHQLRGHQPGEDWQIDFTHMPTHKKFRYLLTLVDTFSGWVEAFPTAKETSAVVAETLLKHIIPRFGLPLSIQSDNGPAFISQVTQQVSEALHITWRLHIPYHPQSSGKVERANGIIKDHLTKLSLELRSSWVDLLPWALMRIRAAPRKPLGLSPFELMYGRPFLVTHQFPTKPPSLANYLPYLTLVHKLLREHADRCLPRPDPNSSGDPDALPLQPGDLVLLKTLHPETLQPRWTGPYTVILTTPTAAKLLGHTSWYHLSRLKPFQASTSPQWKVQQTGPTTLTFKCQHAETPPTPAMGPPPSPHQFCTDSSLSIHHHTGIKRDR